MADGRVEFEITADGRKAYASIDQITEDLRKAGVKWEKDAKTSTDQISGSFEGMVKKIVSTISAAAIGKMLLNIGKDAIQAASDLQEVQNVVDVTFGDAGAQKIESWAKAAGTQFGLTETQAKKFTSTLGAMMKSAGLSGDEIVDMSTNLAGLTADMASFYNLDHDTAFQKIRSGISGETEPLKQLGINMSVANLNAFALQKGLSKTFDKMTQGEQVMLRYQYLMQATSDAQGDFARTSDGFANATRKMETNIETLKTKLGEMLLPTINDVISGINTMLEALTGEHDQTVLDEFANIDLKTAEKIAAVQQTAEDARSLTDVLNGIEKDIEENKDAVGGMLDKAPDGSQLEPLKESVEGVGTTAEDAAKKVGEMTSPSEGVATADALWLDTCKELVKTLPGLGEIINTQTGEIEGGTQAVYDYIDAWEKAQTGIILQSAHEQKRGALEAKASELTTYELDKLVAENKLLRRADTLNAMLQEYGVDDTAGHWGKLNAGSAYAEELGLTNAQVEALNKQVDAYNEANDAAIRARNSYTEQRQAYDEAREAYEEEGRIIQETYAAAIEASGEWTETQKEAAAQLVQSLDDALKAMKEYEDQVRATTKTEVESNISGFGKMKSAADQAKEAANAYTTLEESLKKAGKAGAELEIKLDQANKQITLEGMIEGLDSQLAYIEEYQKNLATARAAGISDEILGMLSDGSNESAMYLNAIAEAAAAGDNEGIQRLNDMWLEVNKGKETFVDSLTQQKLEVDKNYDAMVQKAEEAAAALNVSGAISESTGSNIEAMATAIKAHVPGVAEQVDAVLAELNRLNEWGVTIDYGFGASTVIKPGARGHGGGAQIASLAVGMDWIPFDGFLAQLHQGEAVLTAEENRIWQAFKNGQRGVDYDQLGGMISGIKPGGNVYLDGRVVGQVMSEEQGAQYRTLKRSGWQ